MPLHLPGRDPVRNVLTALALMLLVFLGGLWQRATGAFTPLDHGVQALVAPIQFPALTVLVKVLTRFGAEAGLTLIIALLYWAGRRTESALLLLLLLLAGTAANDHMKNWFELARPNPGETAVLDAADGFGYPSGHTLTGVFLAWIVYHLVGRRLWLCALIAPLMAFTRVYLGVHYFSDTVGGGLHGLAWLFLAGAAVHVIHRLPLREMDDAAIRRAFLGGGIAAAIFYVFMNPAHAAAVRFAPLLIGAGVGTACVPHAWRARPGLRFLLMGLIGLVAVGAVRGGLGAVLPDADLAHSLRYAAIGLTLGASPLAFVALGFAEYQPRAAGADPAGTRAAATTRAV